MSSPMRVCSVCFTTQKLSIPKIKRSVRRRAKKSEVLYRWEVDGVGFKCEQVRWF